MSIARITIMELVDENSMDKIEALYESVREEYYPNLEQVINVRTGPKSAISIALYPSFESAETNLEGRNKLLKMMEPHLKDTFYHEGEVSLNFTSNSSEIFPSLIKTFKFLPFTFVNLGRGTIVSP